MLMLCFTLLFVQVNLVQVGGRSCAGAVGALVDPSTCRNDLDTDQQNVRAILRDFSRPRGSIATADGVLLARSVESHDRYVYQREYPRGDLYGQVTGYYSFVYGSSGIEKQYNDELSGRTLNQQLRSLSDLFSDTDTAGNVTITIRDDLQQMARESLGDRAGTVLVLDPRDGAVLTMWSNPNFDPNPLSHHDTEDDTTARDTKVVLDDAPGHPLVNASIGSLLAPGSTFKLVTAATGLSTGDVTPETPVYPAVTEYQPPYGAPISNFDSEVCGGALFTILARSCNSSFAEMGTETIGPQKMIAGSEKFGFDDDLPIDLPGPKAVSTIRPEANDEDPDRDFTREIPQLSLASIGQGPTVTTPLQMALVVAGIANDGQIMVPHLLDNVRDADGRVTSKWKNRSWRRAMDASTAAVMREAMRKVVTEGTASSMAIPGRDVGAKTGTAETSGDANNAWMVAWGAPEGEEPTAVVVVVVPNVPGHGNASTGSVVAGPVARTMLEAVLERQ